MTTERPENHPVANSEQTRGARTHVVTVFLVRRAWQRGEEIDEVLLVKRSQRVRTYKGAWGAISGYLEPEVLPRDQALTEVREETGLLADDLQGLTEGSPLDVVDTEHGLSWVVHPFLARVSEAATITIDWEAEQVRWTLPSELPSLSTVPRLADAFALVYPARE